jgi:hypothetical protein
MKRLEISIPVPFGVDPDDVIKALHNHENILNNNPLFHSWEKSEHKWSSSVDCSMFFTGRSCTDHPDEPLTYLVVQRVERGLLLRRWQSSTVSSPALLQAFEMGTRGEIKMPQNVMLWSEWTVRRNQADAGWELEDMTRVEGSKRSMFSVRKRVTTAHLDMLRAILRTAGAKDCDASKIEVNWLEQPPGNWMGIGFA